MWKLAQVRHYEFSYFTYSPRIYRDCSQSCLIGICNMAGLVLSNENFCNRFTFQVLGMYRYCIVLLLQTRFKCKWVKFSGDEFKINDGVITDVKHDLPIIGVIQDILIANKSKVIFYVDYYCTSFHPHYRAYLLDKQPFSSGDICPSNLFIEKSIFVRTSDIPELSHSFVILPFYSLCVRINIIPICVKFIALLV